MTSLLMRVIIAIICVVLILAILSPFFRIVGFSIDGDVYAVIRICIAGIAVLYVLRGMVIP